MNSPLLLSVLASCAFLSAATGQNTAPSATPQTQAAAPAGIGTATTASQAGAAAATRNSATRGSAAGRHRSGSTGGGTRQAQGGTRAATPQGQTGITGVPAYAAGPGAQASGPAPAATARVVVTGEGTGGVPDRSLEDGAPLPGIALQHNRLGIAAGTPIQVRLSQTVDSGNVRNGQTVQGSLAAPLGKVAAGSPVELTVVAAARAGEINSYGELSLQIVSINGEPLLSEVITAEGKEGKKILADDAPARGTEAIFTPDQVITLPAS